MSESGFDTSKYYKPPGSELNPARSGLRVRDLLKLVLFAALFCWVAVLTGLAFFSAGATLIGGLIFGLAVIFAQRRSTQQEALLWGLSVAAEKGMPLGLTMSSFAGQCRGRYRRGVEAASDVLERGGSLVNALDEVPGLLSRDATTLVRVGSESGLLANALKQAAADRLGSLRPWGSTLVRILYLLKLIVVLEAIVGFITYFILPKFEAIFADFGTSLPRTTALVIGVTHVLVDYWPLTALFLLMQVLAYIVVAGMLFGAFGWNFRALDRLLWRSHVAMVLRCLSIMTEANRPLGPGLESLARTYPALWVRPRLKRVAEDIAMGDDWAEALSRRALISRAEAGLLDAARRVGNLNWALREAAVNNDRRLSYALQLVNVWLLPVVSLFLGAVVFLIVVAYFVPLITLIQRLAG